MGRRPVAGRQAIRGVSQTRVDQRAEGLGSRDGAAQLLRRAATACAGGEQVGFRLKSLSAVSGTIRRGGFRGTQDGRAPERFRYSDLKEAVVESSSYVF